MTEQPRPKPKTVRQLTAERRRNTPKITDDQLYALNDMQRSKMLMFMTGWMGDDPRFLEALTHAYWSATGTRPAVIDRATGKIGE